MWIWRMRLSDRFPPLALFTQKNRWAMMIYVIIAWHHFQKWMIAVWVIALYKIGPLSQMIKRRIHNTGLLFVKRLKISFVPFVCKERLYLYRDVEFYWKNNTQVSFTKNSEHSCGTDQYYLVSKSSPPKNKPAWCGL